MDEQILKKIIVIFVYFAGFGIGIAGLFCLVASIIREKPVGVKYGIIFLALGIAILILSGIAF